MDSTLLEYFLRVSDLESINKAATSLNLSQPALSRHIAALEHEMGGELFTRSRTGVVLTDAGRLLADRARPLLHQFAMVKEQVGEKAAGQLTIGIPQSWLKVFTSPFVLKLNQTHPGIALRAHDGVSNVLREYLSAGVLDLCIMPFEASTNSNYVQTKLVREPLIGVRQINPGWNDKRELTVADLDGLKIVMPSRANVLRQQVENAMQRRGLNFRLGIETDTLGLCLEFARIGVGVTITPSSSLQSMEPDPTLAWAPIKGLYVTWALYENVARVHSEAVKVGRKLVTKTVAESVASGLWYGAEMI